MIWSILAYMVIGLLGGAIAKAILPGKQGGGIVVTMLLGIAGALLGGFLGSVLFNSGGSSGIFSISGLITSIIGSILILLIFGFITKKKA